LFWPIARRLDNNLFHPRRVREPRLESPRIILSLA